MVRRRKSKKNNVSEGAPAVDIVAHPRGRRRRGHLGMQVWVDEDKKPIRFRLVYIDHEICGVDNGRVVGYDCSHGVAHRHHMGEVTSLDVPGTHEELVEMFEREIMEIRATEYGND